MKFELVMPTVVFVLMYLSSLGYLIFSKPIQWNMVLYWFFAGGLNLVVTYPQLFRR